MLVQVQIKEQIKFSSIFSNIFHKHHITPSKDLLIESAGIKNYLWNRRPLHFEIFFKIVSLHIKFISNFQCKIKKRASSMDPKQVFFAYYNSSIERFRFKFDSVKPATFYRFSCKCFLIPNNTIIFCIFC